MNQDLKDYFRRTLPANCGIIGSQVIVLCLGFQSISGSLLIIAILEILVLTGYLIIFGIKRKDGTLIRIKKIDDFMGENERTERARKELLEKMEHLIEFVREENKQ